MQKARRNDSGGGDVVSSRRLLQVSQLVIADARNNHSATNDRIRKVYKVPLSFQTQPVSSSNSYSNKI